MNEILKDPQMDIIIENIISIFTQIEGVELVRLNGITNYLQKISGKNISIDEVNLIIEKLKNAQIIKYDYIYVCPHCKEKSFIIEFKNENKVKLCDSCQTFYQLIEGATLFN